MVSQGKVELNGNTIEVLSCSLINYRSTYLLLVTECKSIIKINLPIDKLKAIYKNIRQGFIVPITSYFNSNNAEFKTILTV